MIISILAAIALPSFLNQANRAKQVAAITHVSATNRAQQVYRLENSRFATTNAQLGTGLPESTTDYVYTITADGGSSAVVVATPNDVDALRGFSGGVAVTPEGGTTTEICRTTGVQSQAPVQPPTVTSTTVTCSGNMENSR